MTDTIAALGIQTNVIGADKTKNDLDQINAKAKTLAQSTKELGTAQQAGSGPAATFAKAQAEAATATTAAGTATSATAKSFSLFSSMLGGLANAFGMHSSAASGAA
ncbi:MAG: hypothetical protein JWL86_3179, partial [Rhizobium sp.]|nr:hypothetical protein [Rhizobium sp.]